MNTPICDFVKQYANSGTLRLHMPGHKGKSFLGCEAFDITEIDGADSLYLADGIIAESEQNASSLFGCRTFYSTEGSSLSIRAMIHLTLLYAKEHGKSTKIAAARNVHKSFVSAAALLDLDVMWIDGSDDESYLSCKISANELDSVLSSAQSKPVALYITSPDYLGNTADIEELAEICHKHDVLLLVDNAHGAYLKFLPKSKHPIDLGADICCDSAHKTLNVLTGGAYLHISGRLEKMFSDQAKNSLALFGSTSPSYLILQSLDNANKYIAGEYPAKLAKLVSSTKSLKEKLASLGYVLCGNEPTKISLSVKPYGYTGVEFVKILLEKSIVCEFYDKDYVVLMLSPENDPDTHNIILKAFKAIPKKQPILTKPTRITRGETVMTIRKAMLSPREILPVEECDGRILADLSVSCPPAVPVAICGERLTASSLECFKYYGIKSCTVVK